MNDGREALLARWRHLTGAVLPAMASAQGWPIRHDHCFMRVCLDHAVGCRWDRVLPRPAVRSASDTVLAAAVRIAEAVVADPARLLALNAQSLAWRGRAAAARVR